MLIFVLDHHPDDAIFLRGYRRTTFQDLSRITKAWLIINFLQSKLFDDSISYGAALQKSHINITGIFQGKVFSRQTREWSELSEHRIGNGLRLLWRQNGRFATVISWHQI